MISKCVVAAHGHNGPDLFFVKVQCTEQEYSEGDHYQAAEEWAAREGLDGPFVVMDDKDPPARSMWHLFEWDTATVVNVDGEETKPLPIGTLIDNLAIIDVSQFDETDLDMPYQYMLENGEQVWLEYSKYPAILSRQ